MDILDKINDADETTTSSDFWGQVRMDVWECALVKGIGKVPYDPMQHKQSTVAIDLYLDPIPGVDSNFTPERHLVAFEKEWYGLTKPSAQEALQAAGLEPHVRNLPGKYAKITFEPTGRMFTGRDGEQKEKTGIKFLKIFKSENECRADYLTANNESPEIPEEKTETTINQTTEIGKPQNVDHKKYIPFLKLIVQNAVRGENDLDAIRFKIIKGLDEYPMVKNIFTVDSPETTEMIMEAIKK